MAETFRVLVVDDEAMMRDLLTGLLEMEGYVVEVAEEGRSALAASRSAMASGTRRWRARRRARARSPSAKLET